MRRRPACFNCSWFLTLDMYSSEIYIRPFPPCNLLKRRLPANHLRNRQPRDVGVLVTASSWLLLRLRLARCSSITMTRRSNECARSLLPPLLLCTSRTHASLAAVQDIVHLILQYLQDEGYTTSFMTMQDEANVKLAEQQTQRTVFKRMRKAILGITPTHKRSFGPRLALHQRRLACRFTRLRARLHLCIRCPDGDWIEVDKLSSKISFQQQKSFLCAAYRERLVELNTFLLASCLARSLASSLPHLLTCSRACSPACSPGTPPTESS